MQKIAGVQPAHNISGGVREAVVESIVHALVAAAYPPRNMLSIFSNDVDSSVRGPAIHDDIFKIRIALINDGANGFLNKAGSVVYRGNQRDTRPLRGRGRQVGSLVNSAGCCHVDILSLRISGLHRSSVYSR